MALAVPVPIRACAPGSAAVGRVGDAGGAAVPDTRQAGEEAHSATVLAEALLMPAAAASSSDDARPADAVQPEAAAVEPATTAATSACASPGTEAVGLSGAADVARGDAQGEAREELAIVVSQSPMPSPVMPPMYGPPMLAASPAAAAAAAMQAQQMWWWWYCNMAAAAYQQGGPVPPPYGHPAAAAAPPAHPFSLPPPPPPHFAPIPPYSAPAQLQTAISPPSSSGTEAEALLCNESADSLFDGRKRMRGDGRPAGDSSKRLRSKGTGSDAKVCSNCATSATPFWRKDKHGGGPLCNACGLYFAKNDAPRPKMLWKRGNSA
eukprot:jgi/Chlat1/5062/Chrsp33S05068